MIPVFGFRAGIAPGVYSEGHDHTRLVTLWSH